ncbi:MAG: hypothetical protein HQ575_05115 [Candidatus Omnitrophica bacterium]|nr:hypothetical protein [Candidatus Omnitrophota bacterium]
MRSKLSILLPYIILSALCLSLFSLPAAAVEGDEVLEDQLGGLIPGLMDKKIGKLEFDIVGSDTMGYESNYNLDRYDEDSSLFMQDTIGIYTRYPLIDNVCTLRTSYDFIWLRYFEDSEPNLADNMVGVGIDTQIADGYLWSLDYLADFVTFPHDKEINYVSNHIGTSITHDITDWLYQRISYEFSYKRYSKWKITNNQGNFFMGDREDKKNSVSHQFGLFVNDKTSITTDNEIYYNDSTEQFLQYYDYKSYRGGITVNHVATEKLYGSVNFGYQYKAYDKRSVSDRQRDQRDHLFIYGGSLFYDVIPSVSIGTTVDYRNNVSYENDQQYEDLMISSGVYWMF